MSERATEVFNAASALIDKHPSQARRVIEEARGVESIELWQLYARSLYEDEDLVAPDKFARALEILETHCNLAGTENGETLGLAGAIYKRYWDYTGQRVQLEKSLACYARGASVCEDEDGWLAVNTAFVSDLLAVQERRAGGPDAQERAAQRTAYADRIRAAALERLTKAEPKGRPWYTYASIAETAIGLGQFDRAAEALGEGKRRMEEWRVLHEPHVVRAAQYETAARQLANLARLRFHGTPEYDKASAVIQHAFGISEHAVKALFGGKIGLALSGGGFRASLFHIGVLAKLAELDLLRHVEVLSCVSGGSILGAHYYLELKKRLEQGKTTREDYVEIVRDVEKKFLAGVRKNIRTRVAGNPINGLKMAFASEYTRSSRVAELYQDLLYDQTAEDGKSAPKNMSDLMVNPAEFRSEHGETFNPKYDNWRLGAKVPMLVLNATTLNTGHNWQFTATWMGESPQAINETIDAVPRLRRTYYGASRDIAIGTAVGASACVPGLFEPIVLRGLFPERTVRLVDGGVHDNQGLASLLEQNCLVILVSDASGQMNENRNPGGAALNVVGQSNGILQARVREAQFDQLSALRRAGAIQGTMFIHLTKDLAAEPVSWIGAKDEEMRRRVEKEKTSYGIDADIQRKLAAVRTDLDSFSDAEAYALMTSGYRMAAHALLEEKCAPTLPIGGRIETWKFLDIEPAMTDVKHPRNGELRELLAISKELAFKVWRQLPGLKVLAALLGLIAIGAAGALLWSLRKVDFGFVAIIGVVLGVIALGLHFAERKQKYYKRIDEVLVGLGITFAFWASWLHLAIFDRLFLKHGQWPPDARPDTRISDAKLPVTDDEPASSRTSATPTDSPSPRV